MISGHISELTRGGQIISLKFEGKHSVYDHISAKVATVTTEDVRTESTNSIRPQHC